MKHTVASLILVGTVVTLLPRLSHAQSACADGRVASTHTAGRCCWSGQHWSDERGRCEGAPECPAGRVAEGDTCLAATTVPGDVRAPVAEPFRGGEVPPGARIERRQQLGWMAFGASLVAAGYIGGLINGQLTRGYDPNWIELGQWSFVPVAGPLLGVAAMYRAHSDFGAYGYATGTWALAITETVLQVAGIVMIAAGAAGQRFVVRDRPMSRAASRAARWTLAPSAPGAQIGATIAVSHF